MSGIDKAFPQPSNEGWLHGLTKREYIATKIMAGILASNWSGQYSAKQLSKIAIENVDALIAELSKEGGK